MIINKEKIDKCNQKIKDLVNSLDEIAVLNNSNIILTSGYRSPSYNKKIGGSASSWHCKGLAIDFYFENINVFKMTTKLYWLCFNQQDAFNGITEFEVCRGKGMQHFHLAFGNEKELETFTGVYK